MKIGKILNHMKILTMDYLKDNVRLFLETASNESRINYIKEYRWIGYKGATYIMEKLDELLAPNNDHRVDCMLLIGEPNNGKTALLLRYLDLHPSYIEDSLNQHIIPVVYLQAPAIPDISGLCDEILKSINAAIVNEKFSIKQMRVTSHLKKLKVKMLIIDEIHNLLATTAKKQRGFLYFIKNLSNEIKIPIVLAGIRDAETAIKTDYQIESRFETVYLKKWVKNKDFLTLLTSFESIMPLKNESMLREPGLATKIFEASNGSIGSIKKILKKSAIIAIESGIEKITGNIVERAIKPDDF